MRTTDLTSMAECVLHAPTGGPCRRRSRGVALYLTVLIVTVLITSVGLALLGVARINRRVQQNIGSAEQASLLATSALDAALLCMESDASWRTTRVSGQAVTYSIPNVGTVTFTLSDPDGSLSDDESDCVTITATGAAGGATQKLVTTASSRPHPALRFAVVSNQDITFASNDVTVAGPIRGNANILAPGAITLTGNRSFETVLGYAIFPTLQPADFVSQALSLPSANVSFYTSRATTLSGTGLDTVNLTPTANTLGTPNPLGIYHMNAGTSNVNIKKLHLKGTLVITCSGSNLVNFTDRCWIETNPNTGYPVLLVSGSGATLRIDMPSNQLDENDGSRDYNEDGDHSDQFNPSITGLLWTNAGNTTISGPWQMTGCVIAPVVVLDNAIRVDDDPAIATRLIPGFLDAGIRVVAGSVRPG